MNTRAIMWYTTSVLSIIAAILTAWSGNAMCFVWVTAAGVEWQVANNLAKKEEE
jgi:hypothetical protein